jgi:hypothetical protein
MSQEITTDPSIETDENQSDRLISLVAVMSRRVREENLSPLKNKPWARPRDEVNSPVAKCLHWLFLSSEGELRSTWLVMLVLILPFTIAIESLMGASWVLWSALWQTAGLNGFRFIMTGITAILIIPTFYAALGTYWILGAVTRNHKLKSWLRILMAILAIAGLAGLLNSVLTYPLIPGILFNIPQLNEALGELRSNRTYRIIVTIGLYFPAISGFFLILAKGLILFAISFLSVLRWVFNFHHLESPMTISAFVKRPLFITDDTNQSLSDLSTREIGFLKAWATARRDVIQSRLLPLSFMFTFVGLLANTKKANVLFDEVIYHFQVVWGLINGRIPWSWSILGSYAVFLGIILVLFFVTKFLIVMFNESFVADYIVQACVLASPQTSTSSEQPCPESDSQTINVVVDRSFWNRGWLQRILRRRTWDD